MLYSMVCIRDSAVSAYMPPFFVAHVGQAIRGFADQVNKNEPENQLYAHSDDFELYELGSFDDSSATVSQLESPRLLSRGKDVRQV